MISALKHMLPAIENWPVEDQEALAEAAREIEAARTGQYMMTPEEEAAILEGLIEAERGDFASAEEMAALWKKFMA
jgi:predicted transcriptional regulator